MDEMGEEKNCFFSSRHHVPTTIPSICVAAPFEQREYMERWMSGLNQQFTKLSALNWAREFESRSLRNGLYACTAACGKNVIRAR